MSGYLQRLAVSVARPRPSLHPLVGSIFSGERQEAAAAPTLTQNDASAFADEQNLVSTTRTVSDAPDGPMHRRDPAVDDRHRRGEPEILDPLLPRKTPEAGISAMLPETAREDVASAQSASVRLQHYSRDTSIVEAARTTHVAVEDGPSADRQNAIAPTPVSGLRESPGMLAVAAGDVVRPARAEFSAPSRQSVQSDDIQIHIGRIEVTAIAQPAPRPAAPPAHKAMSLDEYLGRRRRGAR